MDIPTIEIDTFVRSIGVNQGSPHALFIGAGASMSSGVPSANACIWQWKKSIFCTNNPGLDEQVAELSLLAVQDRIDQWLNVNSIYPEEGKDEYSYFIEKCLPIADDRRRFFEQWIREARPHIGYKLLCLLAEFELFKSIWTTNFDGLVARAAAEFDLSPIEVGIDCKERIFRQPERKELVCVSLHGDYRYDSLSNTTEELKAQDAKLRTALITTLQTHSLIVSGYSGRDPSVMGSLEAALLQSDAKGKVYWCGFSDKPSENVATLLLAATEKGREAFYVPGAAFDDIMTRIALHCLKGDALGSAKKILDEQDGKQRLQRSAFFISQSDPTAIIKSNAWPIRCPTEMFEFQLRKWPEEHTWRWLEEKTKNHDVVAVPLKKVLAFGTLDGIREAFDGLIDGDIKRVPITDQDIRYEDNAVVSLLRKALVQAVAAKRGLGTDGNRVLWQRDPYTTEREGSRSFKVHKAIRVTLRCINNEIYLTIDPTIYFPDDNKENEAALRSLRLRILGYQHNDKFNTALNDWRKMILELKEPTDFDFPSGSASFNFTVKSAPAFAAIHQKNKRKINILNRPGYSGVSVT